jgi:hypothetical protein
MRMTELFNRSGTDGGDPIVSEEESCQGASEEPVYLGTFTHCMQTWESHHQVVEHDVCGWRCKSSDALRSKDVQGRFKT